MWWNRMVLAMQPRARCSGSVGVGGEEDVAAEGVFDVDGDGADAVVFVPAGEVVSEEGAEGGDVGWVGDGGADGAGPFVVPDAAVPVPAGVVEPPVAVGLAAAEDDAAAGVGGGFAGGRVGGELAGEDDDELLGGAGTGSAGAVVCVQAWRSAGWARGAGGWEGMGETAEVLVDEGALNAVGRAEP